MKNYTLNILACASVLSLASCSGFLDKGPILSQSNELTLSTYDGVNKATAGAYSLLGQDSWYGGAKILEAEMRTGNGIKSLVHTSNRYQTEQNWNYTPDLTSNLWAYGYSTISYANNVIDALPKIVADEADLNNLKAECLFLRALSHFDMVNLYGKAYAKDRTAPGIPVVLHTDPNGLPSRNTVEEVYAQIVTDLKEAESLIDPAYKRSGVTDAKAVVSLPAIQALLSRVFLYMEDWQSAAEYATLVIENPNYSLYSQEEYVGVWAQETGGSEVIFEVYKDLGNLSNEDCSYMTYPEGAYGDCLASPELVALYEAGDVRLDAYCGDSKGTPDLWWTLKYAGKGLSVPDVSNTVVLRLSEMYLNRAEALVNGAVIEGASVLDDLNTIALARGASEILVGGMVSVKTERRKELAWEGLYFFDLDRWGESVVRTPDAFLSESNSIIEPDDHRWALPLAQSELDVNHNLEQNPGY